MNNKLKTFLSQGDLVLAVAKAIGVALFFSFILVWAASAQEKASDKAISTPTPTPTPTPDSLTLTSSEISTRQSLIEEVKPFNAQLQELWNKMISTDDEEKAIGYWYKARATNLKAEAVGNKFQSWLKQVQTAHHCEGCDLQGDKLIPKPLPGQK